MYIWQNYYFLSPFFSLFQKTKFASHFIFCSNHSKLLHFMLSIHHPIQQLNGYRRQIDNIFLLDSDSYFYNIAHQKININFRLKMIKEFMIYKQFLIEENYQNVIKNSVNLNIKYERLCSVFAKQYQIFKIKNMSMRLPQNVLKQGQYQFVSELKRFMEDFTSIISDISNFQIECLSNLKSNNRPELDLMSKFIEKIRQNKKISQDLQNSNNKLSNFCLGLKSQFNKFKKKIQNPINFYDQQLILYKKEKINKQVEEAKQIFFDIKQKKHLLQIKLGQLQPYITKFKCKMVKNKYSVYKKIVELVQNTKNCSIQMIDLLRDCAVNGKDRFKAVMEDQSDDILYLKKLSNRQSDDIVHYSDLNKLWEYNTALSLEVFLREVGTIEAIFYQKIAHFKQICNNYHNRQKEFKELINQIHSFYQQKESPYNQMMQLLTLEQELHLKFKNIIDRINNIIKNIIQIKDNCRKHVQILLALLKVKNANNQGFLQSRNYKLMELMSAISFSGIKKNILSFYNSCIITQNQMLDTFTIKPRRKTNDSMDISHSITHYPIVISKKIPLKEERWLWRDWKYQIQVNQKFYVQLFQQINQFVQNLAADAKIKQTTSLQSYDCTLLNAKIQGKLILKINSCQFISQTKIVTISWKEITDITFNAKFFQKIIALKTNNGIIQFSDFQDTTMVLNSLKEIQQKSLMPKKTKIQKKKQIHLSNDQIKFIQQRKIKIKDSLPKLQNLKLIIEKIFQNQTIDEIYELIYSDKPFNFYGRQEACFFSYTGKKSGNFNWLPQKYDKPGPQFYSLVQGVNFLNCPLFSTRIITYNHPMKPTSIPFMPKSCGNKDQRKIYWVSHQELIYVIRSITEGVPFADTFYVQILHRITKVEKGVKIQIYSNVVFVKQTSFKTIIFNSTDPEVDTNMIQFMKQIQKLMKLRKDIASGEAVQIQLEQQSPKDIKIIEPSNDMSKLKLYNRLLLTGLALLLIVNILYAFIY